MLETMSQLDLVVQQTAMALLRLRGETAGQALAVQLVRRWESLTDDERTTFFHFLLSELGPDPTTIDQAISQYKETPGAEQMLALSEAAESQRQPLFRALNTAPGGITALLEMRTELLGRRRSHPELAPVEKDLSHLLRSWFNRGFLRLEQLDWNTPAQVLEKLIEYEAVHEIRGWDDLRRRLAPDRRSYGFFHPALPGEPVIFVEVALTTGMAASIQDVIDAPATTTAPTDADTAIFYSITNCQTGLRGVSFGSFLIKQVTELLRAEIPELETFATLSPIPGFASWSEEHHPDADTSNRSQMEQLCAAYLLGARRGPLPLDPVARFHLRNGARVERINWAGDTSAKGLGESHGLLVNYRYSGQDLPANHDLLVNVAESSARVAP
jgi:malonyl-CoA decarboxylase